MAENDIDGAAIRFFKLSAMSDLLPASMSTPISQPISPTIISQLVMWVWQVMGSKPHPREMASQPTSLTTEFSAQFGQKTTHCELTAAGSNLSKCYFKLKKEVHGASEGVYRQ